MSRGRGAADEFFFAPYDSNSLQVGCLAAPSASLQIAILGILGIGVGVFTMDQGPVHVPVLGCVFDNGLHDNKIANCRNMAN